MTGSELRAIGEGLFGLRWQRDLARELSVNERTVRYWLHGGRAMSIDREIQIHDLLSHRRDLLERLRGGVETIRVPLGD